jgi:hypothetical protein
MTALDLITRSLKLIGVLSDGEAPSSSEANDALESLNDMIDSWSTQSLLIPNQIREVFPLVASQQTYTMGTGGNFNTSRPMSIIRGIIQLTNETPVVELPMQMLTMEQYAGIILKGTPSTFPLAFYSDNAFPLTNISVWPVPTCSSNNLVLYSWKPLADLAALTTVISLPPGYARALRFNLAIDLAPEYSKPLDETVAAKAIEAKADIKRMNQRPRFLQVDDAVRSNGGVYNWRTDGYER